MCGIVGYVGDRPVQEILLAGLEKLEYRGYDSAGISLQGPDGLEAVRAVGNLAHLREAVERDADAAADGAVAVLAPPATTGIGHTRWATHGRVSEENAHPHFDDADRVHVVVNGIVENYMELKQELDRRRRRPSPRRPTPRSSPTSSRAPSTARSRTPSAPPTRASAATTRSSPSPPTSPASSSPPARSARSSSAAATASSSSARRSPPSSSTRATSS